jgi:TPR repeat protein
VKAGNSSEPLESKKKPKMGMAVLAVVLFAIIGWQCSRFINVFSDNLDQKGSQTVAELAEQGDAKAQYNLGYMYREGKGVEQDFKEAVKW